MADLQSDAFVMHIPGLTCEAFETLKEIIRKEFPKAEFFELREVDK
jgi:hypothetical protein